MMSAEDPRLAVVLAVQVPRIMVVAGVGVLRFLAKRKRGVRAFRTVLLRGGLTRPQAAALAQAYHEAGSLRLLLRGMGSRR